MLQRMLIMDLNNLKPVLADEGAVLQVVHPDTQEPIEGMTITLRGQDSNVYEKISLKKQQSALARISRGKNAMDVDANQLQTDMINDLVALTVDWTGFELDGKPLKPTHENIRHIYTGWKWLKELAQEFVADRANFFRAAD
jgi:hypothetical protein